MAVRERQLRGGWPLWLALGIGVAGIAAHTLYLLAGSPPELSDATDAVYNASLFAFAVTCFLRAARSARLRGAWAAFGVGLTLWALADTYWTVAFSDVRHVPYPSLADVGYLATIPAYFVGIALLTRHRVGRFTAQKWLDGAVAALAAAALGTALLAPALLGLTKGDAAAVLTNLAYPLGDLILIAFVASAVVVSGLRGAGALLLIGAGLLVWTGADSIYLYLEATSSYKEGWLDSLWLVGAFLVAFAACFSVRHAPVRQAAYHSPLWLPGIAALASVGILVWDHFDRLHEPPVLPEAEEKPDGHRAERRGGEPDRGLVDAVEVVPDEDPHARQRRDAGQPQG